jgi:hypothetical protein
MFTTDAQRGTEDRTWVSMKEHVVVPLAPLPILLEMATAGGPVALVGEGDLGKNLASREWR